MKLFQYTAHELHDMLTHKKISATELANAIYERIEAVENDVRAYLTLTKEAALAQAAKFDEKLKNNTPVAPLAGIPGALKDNMCTNGLKTTCGSKILENFIPPYNATIVEKLAEQDCIIVGKTNMDEFAMGSSTENSAFFNTRNPWDLRAVPGGSSGGSAAAVAAGEAIWSLGSDTGGSIRQPACFCGLVGLKPTYGRVSRYGLVAFASSLDQIGPFAKDVTDCALVMNAISGHDPKDSTSISKAVPDFTKALLPDVKGLKIGLPREFFGEGMESAVEQTILKAVEQFKALGAKCIEVSMPHVEYALAVYYLLATAEASSNLARFDGVCFGYRGDGEDIISMYKSTRSQALGPEVQRRIMLGTYALSSGYYDAYYLKALKVRTLIRQDFDKAFEQADLLLTPTSPTLPFKFGEKVDNPLAMYLMDVCTIPINLAGVPAISIPCGFSEGLPIGMQLIGKLLGEETIFRAAYTFEQNNEYHKCFAPLKEGK